MLDGTECQQYVSRPCREVWRRDVRVSGGERCSEAPVSPWVRHLVSVSMSLTNEAAAIRHASLAPSLGVPRRRCTPPTMTWQRASSIVADERQWEKNCTVPRAHHHARLAPLPQRLRRARAPRDARGTCLEQLVGALGDTADRGETTCTRMRLGSAEADSLAPRLTQRPLQQGR